MKKLILTVALVLTACGGATGPAGPTGPTGPSGPPGSYAKGDLYCLVAGEAPADAPAGTDTTTWSLSKSCLDANDLPLTGSCANGASGLPAGVWLAADEPRNWTVTDQPASWFCQWQTSTPSPVTSLIGTRAEICCITH